MGEVSLITKTLDIDITPLTTDGEIANAIADIREEWEHNLGPIHFDGDIKIGSKKYHKAVRRIVDEMERDTFNHFTGIRDEMAEAVEDALQEYGKLIGKQEIFRLTEGEMDNPEAEYYENEPTHYEPGWYWWWCLPGCLPDGAPYGPFDNEEEAWEEARQEAAESVEWPDRVDWLDIEKYAQEHSLDCPTR